MYIAIVILLLVFGVGLLVAEMFLLPGFGIAGVSGFACLAGSVVVAYLKLAPLYPWAGHVTLAAALVLTGLAIYGFFRSHAIDKMALDTTIDSNVELAAPGKKIENLKKE
jgi:membrane-bound ClpP family serine protease